MVAPPANTVTRFRVIVPEGVTAGQLVRAGVAGKDLASSAVWLIRVPATAVTGDSFTFTITAADEIAAATAAAAAAVSSTPLTLQWDGQPQPSPYIIENAVLEQSLLQAIQKSGGVRYAIEQSFQDILEDPSRVVCLGFTLFSSFIFGIVQGSLFFTRNDTFTTSR